MTRMKSKLLAVALCLAMVLTTIPAQAFANTTSYVTREQAVAELINTIGLGALNETVSDLNTFLDAAQVSSEYMDELGIAVTNGILETGQELEPKEPITRLEFVFIINRAIRELPAFLAPSAFSDVPDEAVGEVNRLVRAGITKGYGNGQFGSEDYLTQDQLDAVLGRIKALALVRPQDDYYYSVNYDWFTNTKLPAGYTAFTTFSEVDLSNHSKLKEDVAELYKNKGTYRAGTVEQKLADFYSTIVDTESRNKQGIAPIKGYLELVDQAKTVEELLDAMVKLEKEAGLNLLFAIAPSVDLKDSNRYVLASNGLSTHMSRAYLIMDNPQIKQLYQDLITKISMLAGDTQQQAMLKAQSLYEFELLLAQHTMSNEDASKIENVYNTLSIEELAGFFPHVDIRAYISNLGYGTVSEIIVSDIGLMKKTGELMSNENLDILKIYAKTKLLIAAASYLSEDFEMAVDAFSKNFYGQTSSLSKEDKAYYMFNSVMNSYLGRIYVEKYFSDEARRDVEDIVHEVAAAFEKRIENLDWMSESTKQAAIGKLRSIKVKIGYPDNWYDPLDGIDIKSYEDGGSFIGNILNITAATANYNKTLLGKPVDKSGWTVSPQTVDAFYNYQRNEITLPAGILQPPYYDVSASREQNLGGIGTIIAHEITHAFDNNGAQFDKDGNMRNWWNQEDYAIFQQRCQEVTELFDGIEIAPNAFSKGEFIVSECVADLGGMACILDIAKTLPHANYKELFESNAKIWRITATPQMYQILVIQDNHAPYKLRVNQILRNFQEFYDTYGVQPDDPMYLAPEERVTVW